MPYRRLPNTDQARLRAMEAGLEMGKRTAAPQLAFSRLTLERIQMFYPKFSGAVRQLRVAKQTQFDRSKDYGEQLRKARLYLSHFLQVLNFAIIRDELKPQVREYYGMKANSKVIPQLGLESQVLAWGERAIAGEQKRIQQGGSPIYSPSIALVKVHYEEFRDAYHTQKMLQTATARASQKVADLRDECDQLIQQMWNEVEQTYQDLPDELKREKAQRYGLVYVFRASELKQTKEEPEEELVYPG